MLNAIIRFALRQRLLVVAFSLFLLGYGVWQATHMDIDVFPNLNRPRVVVMTEAPGMAPEEVEALITFPLETALNGANGVEAVRTSSGVGISVIYVEFDWGTNIYDDRQIVMERIQLVKERLPEGVQPTLAPISSIMGQIVMMGMWSQENERTLITKLPTSIQPDLDAGQVPQELRESVKQHVGDLSSKALVESDGNAVRWIVTDERQGRRYPVHFTSLKLSVEYRDDDQSAGFIDLDVALANSLDRGIVPPELLVALREQGTGIEASPEFVAQPQTVRWFIRDEQFDRLFVVRKAKGKSTFELHQLTSPLRLRTLADWVVRQRLLTIPGVSQVFTMGGGRKQFQVLIDPDALLRYGITLHDVKKACIESNQNATGGYLDEQGPNELLVRALGRIQGVEDLRKVVVTIRDGRPVTLRQVARVVEGPQVKRGDSSAYKRNKDGSYSGGRAVVLTINKQPGADTRAVTDEIVKALAEVQPALPPDVHIEPELYSQKAFIDRAIENVAEALRDGGILVLIILFLFLMNFRTTFITLTAIPMSIAITAVVFTAFGLSINTMTLGGLAIAIGELVDDAIVDVENIFRRLKENRHSQSPKHPLLVVFQASVEIRNSIVFGTIIVVLVFVPLFALSGMEGRLFTPLGVAYIVSILSSLLVSLTLTPVLSYWLLGHARLMEREQDGPLLRFLKWGAHGVIHASIRFANPVLIIACVAVGVAFVVLINRERDFLPPFNEGSVQLNVILPPGTSLRTSNEISRTVEGRLTGLNDVLGFVRRTGRAELDEHAEGVSFSESIIELDPDSPRSREEQLEEIRKAVEDIPGIQISVEQPLAHLISHMLSGIKAQVGIKIYGDDLDTLRQKAQELKAAMESVEGVEDLIVEPQVVIPQLRIELDRDKLESYGLTPVYVNDYVNTAMNGQVVSEVLIGQRTFDLLVRMEEKYRENRQVLKRLSIDLPGGGTTPLSSLAKIYESGGPNTINREKVRRRIVIQCNVSGRGLVDVVEDIQARHRPVIAAWNEPGYFVEYGGQFESEQAASRVIGVLFGVSLLAIFLVLYTMFRSANFSLQVMSALPMAFIGSVAALVLTDQKLTVASMVGFISLGGIASRNGILLINHYLHLVRYEGESWTQEMIIRAGKERLAPVLMTALTSGIGLVPLALAAGEPGKEILYPVATVIIGGLLSSTILEFLVRPALFWTFGRNVGERLVAESRAEVPLVEESEMHRAQHVAEQFDVNFRPEEGRTF